MSSRGLDAVECLFNWLSPAWIFDACSDLRVTWILSVFACISVILTGIFPALFLTAETGAFLNRKHGLRTLNRLLSFAVGTLLGEVFLHLLPESIASDFYESHHHGLWVIGGLMFCFLIEKFCAKTPENHHKVTAFMNLTANLVDNFTHGLAVGGSFRVSSKVGLVTTFAILIHEIPHEIGDFAILLRANFNRWGAIKAQLFTALGGVLGATVALVTTYQSGPVHTVNWVLPFTAGGFLNIALVQVLPDLMGETSTKESLIHMALIALGMTIMGVVNTLL